MEETIIRTIDDDLISEAQFRFRPKYNSWIPYTFAPNMDKILNSSGEVRITVIDIKTAFDRIRHQMARIRHRVARLEQTRSKRNLPRWIISPTKRGWASLRRKHLIHVLCINSLRYYSSLKGFQLLHIWPPFKYDVGIRDVHWIIYNGRQYSLLFRLRSNHEQINHGLENNTRVLQMAGNDNNQPAKIHVIG